MTTSFTRFAAIATATAGILTAQSAAAGVLFTHNGGNTIWEIPSNWTGGTGVPDQPTEDARISSGVFTTIRTNINIGGIESEPFGQVAVGTYAGATGSLTLHGITPGGTTPFTSSTLNRLLIEGGGGAAEAVSIGQSSYS